MPEFPERLMAGSDEQATTYTLAEGHYLIHTPDGEQFSAIDRFADEGLMPEEIPRHIEAARRTLEPAGFRWVQIAPTFSARAAEERFEADDRVDEVRPVYFVQGGGVESAATPMYETINVEFEDAADPAIGAVEAQGVTYDPHASGLLAPVHVFRVDEGADLEQAAALLDRIADLPEVKSAGFDWLKLETYTAAPNDPLFGNQWGLNAINLASALDVAAGSSSVLVAIIDSGFDLGHPDIDYSPVATHFNAQQALAGNPGPYDAGSSGVFHGTAVAGIAAARTNNAVGVAGVGGGCQVMPIRLGTVPSSNRVAAGVNWAAANGARAAGMSLTTTVTTAATNAMANAWAAGLVLCAATGNSGGNTTSPAVGFPANHANVIAVGAADANLQRKRPASVDGECWGSQFDNNTDVIAPGVRIWTTDEQGGAGYNSNNGGAINWACVAYPSSGDAAGDYVAVFNGTSAATPHVAGLAGLLFSADPTATNAEVRDAIESSCAKVNPGLYPYATVAGRPNGTWHQEVGYGLIDARAALDALLGTAAPEIAFREGWITFPRTTGRRQRRTATVDFGRPIATHQAMLKGFNIRYDNGDHHLLETEIDLDSSVSGSVVTVHGDFVLRDSSGTFDDPYRGWINFVVMAQLA